MNIDKKVDALINGQKKPKHRYGVRRRTLYSVLAVLGVALVISVAGTILPYFGRVETTVEVEQAITIDGNDWNDPVTYDVGQINTGCPEEVCTDTHVISNTGCEPVCLDWDYWGTPDLEGIDIGFFVLEEIGNGCCDHILETLEVRVLDGQADSDDFTVFVDGSPVYSYQACGGDETWITHTIDLTPFEITCCGDHVISIVCDDPTPWEYFDPYGQLAVDTIALYCEDHVLCDSVDIGKTASESGHALTAWGPIEPANTGGAYGGIDDCRCTWFYKPEGNPDGSGASVVLRCEECYEPEYEWVFYETPFCIYPGEDIEFKFCYKFHEMLGGGIYTIYHDLILGTDCQCLVPQ